MAVEEIIEPSAFYKQLTEILDEHHEDVGSFLKTIFTFVKTKTTYFAGVKDPRIPVVNSMKEAGVAKGKNLTQPKPSSPSSSSASARKKTNSSAPTTPSSPPAAEEEVKMEKQEQEKEEEEEEGDKGLVPNAGNGADLGKYSWTQTLDEVTMTVPAPAGIRASDVTVDILKEHLRIAQKSSSVVLLEGGLSAAVKPEECFWSIVDESVEVTLYKVTGMTWWKNVMDGDPEINTQKVVPENSNLSDLDADTRQTVEKMMYDQQRKQQGLPTTDDMKKQEMLEKFMKQHPEMDFSNAKIG